MTHLYIEDNDNIELKAWRGAWFYKHIIWSRDGAVVDLSSATASMKARSITYPTVASNTVTMGSALFTLSSTDYIILGGTNGSIEILIPATTLSAVTSGIYYYDLEVTISGENFKPIHGNFVVKAGTNV